MSDLEIIKSVPVIISINEIITKKQTKITDYLIRDSAQGLNPILLHINTLGGDLTTAISIISVIKIISSDVYTYVSGEASSAGALILMSGKKGYRFADRNSSIMIHEAYSFKCIDESEEDFTSRVKTQNSHVQDIIVNATGQKKSVVKDYIKKDAYFTPKQALKFGMIDRII